MRWFGDIIAVFFFFCKIRKTPVNSARTFLPKLCFDFFSKHNYTFWRSSFSYGWDNLGGFCNSRRHVCDDVTSCLFCKIERDHLTGFIWEFMVFFWLFYTKLTNKTLVQTKNIYFPDYMVHSILIGNS